MKIALTGASGFLGRALLGALAGHEVVAICRRPERLSDSFDVERRAADVLEPDSLEAAFEGCELVVHSGGGVSHHRKGATKMEAVHVTGTRNALTAARTCGVSRFVQISTSGAVAVSNSTHAVGREDDPSVLPVVKQFPYYRAKLFAEQEAMAFQGLDVYLLNPTLMLGPNDPEGRSVSIVKRYLDEPLPVAPPGAVSFVDVRDVAAAVPLLLERGQTRRRYLLGAWNGSFLAFYERVARAAGLPSPTLAAPAASGRLLGLLPDPLRRRAYDVAGLQPHELALTSCSWMLDASRARQELHWMPRDPGETISDTIADLRS